MTLDKLTARIQEMFGQIAGRYHFLNRLLSLGIDRAMQRPDIVQHDSRDPTSPLTELLR
jgi:ubiquinone/menaquinone biosynthesis C-methylase UbiE